MKIRIPAPEIYSKVAALLLQTFSPSRYEVQLFDKLHEKKRTIHEWVCIHRDMVTAYIAFTHAYNGTQVSGLHLTTLAVTPQMQGQGIGSELLRFCMRQEILKDSAIFVLGPPKFYTTFGFDRCQMPVCPFQKNNAQFLSIRNNTTSQYTVGYEPEFKVKGAGRTS